MMEARLPSAYIWLSIVTIGLKTVAGSGSSFVSIPYPSSAGVTYVAKPNPYFSPYIPRLIYPQSHQVNPFYRPVTLVPYSPFYPQTSHLPPRDLKPIYSYPSTILHSPSVASVAPLPADCSIPSNDVHSPVYIPQHVLLKPINPIYDFTQPSSVYPVPLPGPGYFPLHPVPPQAAPTPVPPSREPEEATTFPEVDQPSSGENSNRVDDEDSVTVENPEFAARTQTPPQRVTQLPEPQSSFQQFFQPTADSPQKSPAPNVQRAETEMKTQKNVEIKPYPNQIDQKNLPLPPFLLPGPQDNNAEPKSESQPQAGTSFEHDVNFNQHKRILDYLEPPNNVNAQVRNVNTTSVSTQTEQSQGMDTQKSEFVSFQRETSAIGGSVGPGPSYLSPIPGSNVFGRRLVVSRPSFQQSSLKLSNPSIIVSTPQPFASNPASVQYFSRI